MAGIVPAPYAKCLQPAVPPAVGSTGLQHLEIFDEKAGRQPISRSAAQSQFCVCVAHCLVLLLQAAAFSSSCGILEQFAAQVLLFFSLSKLIYENTDCNFDPISFSN